MQPFTYPGNTSSAAAQPLPLPLSTDARPPQLLKLMPTPAEEHAKPNALLGPRITQLAAAYQSGAGGDTEKSHKAYVNAEEIESACSVNEEAIKDRTHPNFAPLPLAALEDVAAFDAPNPAHTVQLTIELYEDHVDIAFNANENVHLHEVKGL